MIEIIMSASIKSQEQVYLLKSQRFIGKKTEQTEYLVRYNSDVNTDVPPPKTKP
jgi:hypothetical protein